MAFFLGGAAGREKLLKNVDIQKLDTEVNF